MARRSPSLELGKRARFLCLFLGPAHRACTGIISRFGGSGDPHERHESFNQYH